MSICITLGTLVLTSQFFKKQQQVEASKIKILEELRHEEKKRIKIWADAVSQIASLEPGQPLDPCVLDILKSNKSIPAIWLGSNKELKAYRNIDSLEVKLKNKIEKFEKNKIESPELINLKQSLDSIQTALDLKFKIDSFLMSQIYIMKDSIPIEVQSAIKDKDGNIVMDKSGKPRTEITIDYVYYNDSYVIKEVDRLYEDSKDFTENLQYFPVIILLVTSSIFLVAYLAFDFSQKSQKNKLWAGIAKETAHQIGTPLSSLMGWVEYLKNKNIKIETINEIEKDTNRLQQIADRFSKIGSAPVLKSVNIIPVLDKTIDYVKKRASKNIKFSFEFDEYEKDLKINLSSELFSWVIENLLKNSIDSVQSSGFIKVRLKNKHNGKYIIDVIDNGKGISSYDFKKIFDPGYTSKKRGWGLGLSLCQRIISEYHQGKIFVLKSTPFKETIIRILLK